jgi:hypothetical protein
MAKKQVGPTPITAKLKRTTKGGITQPSIKGLEAPTKFINPASFTKRITSGVMEAAKHRSNAQKGGYGGNLATGYGFMKGFLSGEYSGSAKSTAPKPTAPKPSKDSGPKKGTYDYAKAGNADLDNIISKRNKATKGSAEYNRYQNQINKAYGVGPTNRNTTEKLKAPGSNLKPSSTSVSTKPTASTTITPKTKKAETSAKASKLRAKGEKALAEGNTVKAKRIRGRYDRKTERDEKQAARKTKRGESKALRQSKRKLIQEQRSKFKSAKKEIKTYKDY